MFIECMGVRDLLLGQLLLARLGWRRLGRSRFRQRRDALGTAPFHFLGPATYLLLNGAIPTEPLGEFQLKGLQQKIQAYRVAKG